MSEAARLGALARLGLRVDGGALGESLQGELDAIVRLTAHISGMPVAAVNLIDEAHFWQAATVGMAPVVLPRGEALCDTTVRGDGIVYAADATTDPRFADLPMVLAGDVRTYAGAPLVTAAGENVGALCVVDSQVHALNDAALARLGDLARIVMTQLELRATMREREEADRLRATLLDNILVGVVLQDATGRVVECNEASSITLGRSRSELLGGAAAALEIVRVDGTPYPVQDRPSWLALRTGESQPRGIFGVRLDDGTLRWLRVQATPIRHNGERHVVTSFGDITRSVDQQRELAEARDAAESASQEKSRFLATMSHEIRTPLNGVVGAVSLLAGTALDAEQSELVSTAQTSGEALLSVVSDVLDLSKIEAGGLELEQLALPLAATVASAVAVLATEAAVKGLALSAGVDSALPVAVIGDPGRLRQALVNLVANAVKFTAAGSVTVTVTPAGEPDLMRFAVTDTGIGVPASVAPMLFRPFQQAGVATTRHFGGTGLGLAIVLELASLMGGSAGVESEPGQGSTFWFTARLAPAELPPAAPEIDGPRLPPARVLVVEDDPVNRRIAGLMLHRLGMTVESANDGSEALARMDAGGIDLVLMDVQMPGLDGPETTRRLRLREAASGASRLTVVALTAAAFAEDRRECLEAGMDDFLAKPMRLDDLQGALRRHLVPLPRGPRRAG